MCPKPTGALGGSFLGHEILSVLDRKLAKFVFQNKTKQNKQTNIGANLHQAM
jgi:hypothetical protein